jgi:hypothetical protein
MPRSLAGKGSDLGERSQAGKNKTPSIFLELTALLIFWSIFDVILIPD